MAISSYASVPRPVALPARPAVPPAAPTGGTASAPVQPSYIPVSWFSPITFGPAAWVGAAIGGFARGRGAGAIGAVAAVSLHNLALLWSFSRSGNLPKPSDWLVCVAPMAATAAGAAVGFQLGGPTGALLGALLPSAPHMVAAAGIVATNGVFAVRQVIERVRRWLGYAPTPPDGAAL